METQINENSNQALKIFKQKYQNTITFYLLFPWNLIIWKKNFLVTNSISAEESRALQSSSNASTKVNSCLKWKED